MSTTTRKCLVACSLCAVAAIYAAAAYRVEQARSATSLHSTCSYTVCIPHSSTFSSLR
jgi:hypothetical protein